MQIYKIPHASLLRFSAIIRYYTLFCAIFCQNLVLGQNLPVCTKITVMAVVGVYHDLLYYYFLRDGAFAYGGYCDRSARTARDGTEVFPQKKRNRLLPEQKLLAAAMSR